MIKRLLPFVMVAAGLMLVTGAHAADPIAMTISNIDEQVGSMTVNFTVTDDTGRDSALTPADVRAFVDGKGLRIADVQKTNYGRQPASIVLLVDVSGSMYGEPITQVQAAVRDFVSQVEPDDRVALMSFSTGVTLLQDFTSDRSVLDAAAGGLTAFGDTALYDAVNAAIDQANTAPEGGRLVVLLSDGVATEGKQNRDASLKMAADSGTTFVAVGLGPSVDVDYLKALTSATGGRYVPAATAAQLRATYSEIAKGVTRRYFSDYTMQLEVPPNIDRTIDSTVKIEAAVHSEVVSTEAPVGPLDGAVPPPYEVKITGVAAGGTLAKTATAGVVAPEGRELTSVQYLLDGEAIGSGTDGLATVALDPAAYKPGTHTFSVRTVDVKGGEGYGELSFLVPPPAAAPPPPAGKGSSLPLMPILLLLVAAGIAYALYRVVQARLAKAPEYVTRSLMPEPAERAELAQMQGETTRPARGRIVVMRESAIMAGDLHTTREYELRDAPLTIGTGGHVDIQLEDESGLIAEEEARVWVQRGRITLHRLTALSAMATAGVTPGWEFFDDGDELRIGAYRLVFKVEAGETRPETRDEARPSIEMPQEHGMTLRPSDPLGWDNR